MALHYVLREFIVDAQHMVLEGTTKISSTYPLGISSQQIHDSSKAYGILFGDASPPRSIDPVHSASSYVFPDPIISETAIYDLQFAAPMPSVGPKSFCCTVTLDAHLNLVILQLVKLILEKY